MAIEDRRDFRVRSDFITFDLFKRCFDVGALVIGKTIVVQILRFHREQDLHRIFLSLGRPRANTIQNALDLFLGHDNDGNMPRRRSLARSRSKNFTLRAQQASALTLPGALFLGLALVVQLLTLGESELDLGAALFVENRA